MSSFEDRLWSELASTHGRALVIETLVPARRRSAAARLLAAAAVVLAALVAGATLWLSGGAGEPAYAVTQHRDGTVTVTILRLVGVQGADARLAALGVPVRTAAFEPRCSTLPTAFRVARVPPSLIDRIRRIHGGPGNAAVTVSPEAIPAGDTLLLAARRMGNGTVGLSEILYRGAAPSCLPVSTRGGSGPP